MLNSDEIKIAPVGYTNTFLKLGYTGGQGGEFDIYSKNGNSVISAYVDGSDNSIFSMSEADGSGLGLHMAVAYGGGQISVLSKGNIKGGILAHPSGAELRLGGGDPSWKIAWNTGDGSYVQADHHKFLGKSDGLITGAVSTSECSAYIVIGQPTKGGYYSSVTIPSDLATGRTWQIADENCYVTFTISSNGDVTQTGSGKAEGSSATPGSIKFAYSIR